MVGRTALCTLIALAIANVGWADEDAAAEEPETGWEHHLVSGLTLTQISLSNWEQGGEEAVAWTTTLDGKSSLAGPKLLWDTTYKLAFGQTKLGDEQARKTDDKMDLETVLTLDQGFLVDPYIAATFKTQFAEGYDYPEDSDRVAVSSIFDPAYFTQSAGLGYRPADEVRTRLGVALRETVTDAFNTYADDPDTADIETTRTEGGLESVTDVEWQLRDNVRLSSKLEIFTAFQNLSDLVIRDDTTVVVKVTEWVSIKLNVLIVREDRVVEKTQVKQTIAGGLNYDLL
jgi:hypothetical protein